MFINIIIFTVLAIATTGEASEDNAGASYGGIQFFKIILAILGLESTVILWAKAMAILQIKRLTTILPTKATVITDRNRQSISTATYRDTH